MTYDDNALLEFVSRDCKDKHQLEIKNSSLCEDEDNILLFRRRIKDVTCPASYKSSQVAVSFCGGRNSLLNQVRGVQTQDERGKVT